MKLSIIIVNYNVTQLLRNCLSSIQKFVKNIDYEVIVMDNASTDSSWKDLVEEFPAFNFIENLQNDGFSKANNKAVKLARGEYILLLNPDTEIEGDYLAELVEFASQQKKFGCLGVRMHDADDQFLPESKRAVPNISNSFEKLFTNFRDNYCKSYYRNDIGQFEIAGVEVITGAFLLCNKAVYNAVGGLDERYFMYGEDIDFCFTLLQNGFKNWYYGKASILHHKGESTVKDEVYLERFYGAMQIFVAKYYQKRPFQKFFLTSGLRLKHHFEKLRQK